MAWDCLEWPGMAWNSPGWLGMSQDGQEWPGMVQNGPEWPRMSFRDCYRTLGTVSDLEQLLGTIIVTNSKSWQSLATSNC